MATYDVGGLTRPRRGTTDAACRERQTVCERSLGVARRRHAIDTRGADAAGEGTAFEAQPIAPSAPTPRPTEEALLVVQAAGTGVPLGQPAPVARPVRRGQGQQRTTQPAAVVTSR